MALVAAPSSWTHSLPYHHAAHTPLRPQSATWNTKFPSTPSYSGVKPRLRLAVQVVVPAVEEKRPAPPPLRFDPFADEPPVASTSQLPPATQNTPPPASARGRTLTPLSISVAAPAPTPSSAPATPPPTGRRRAPSFSAGSGAALPRSLGGLSSLTRAAQLYPHNLHPASSHSSPHASSSHPVYNNSSSYSLCSAPSPAPSLARSRSPQPPPPPPPAASGVANAPSAFHARHYPTPDARARLLARTLLTRIHAVGRPRGASAALYSCAKGSSPSRKNGYESACGARGYVPSRLRECTVAC